MFKDEGKQLTRDVGKRALSHRSGYWVGGGVCAGGRLFDNAGHDHEGFVLAHFIKNHSVVVKC